MQVNGSINNRYDIPVQNQEKKSIASATTDWYSTMQKIMESYLETEIQKKNEDCREIFYELSQYKPRVAMDGMEALKETNPEIKENFELSIDKEETKDYGQLIREKMEELFTKIKNGESEPTYQIGAQSFTEDEWEKLLDNFDSIEDMVKELLKEKQKKEMEAALQEVD